MKLLFIVSYNTIRKATVDLDCLGLSPISVVYWLCDLRQVILPLWVLLPIE